MTVTEKCIRNTVHTSDGICGIKAAYPFVEGIGNARRLNKFFADIGEGFARRAAVIAEGEHIFSLEFSTVYQDDAFCSILFEKTVRCGRNMTAYRPFSVTFSQKNGNFLSLPLISRSLCTRYPEVKKTAKKYGISISFSEFSRCFCLTENGAFIYRSVFVPGADAYKIGNRLRKFYISE